jgi:hypothetical protein
MRKFRKVIRAETFYGMRFMHKFRNFKRSTILHGLGRLFSSSSRLHMLLLVRASASAMVYGAAGAAMTSVEWRGAAIWAVCSNSG